MDKLTTHYSPLFDALGTFPDGIAQHSTLSAGKTWHGEQRVVRFGLLGGYPGLQKQGEMMSCVSSEKRASGRE